MARYDPESGPLRVDSEKSAETQDPSDSSKNEVDGGAAGDSESHDLHRALKARHITMIAIGGAIGTGLIIGTGAALAKGGPVSILLSYSIVGFIVFLVMCAVGEMATWLPLAECFQGYASRFADPALGFTVGYTYWFKYCIVTPNQLTAAALIMQFWIPPEKVNPGIFVAIWLAVIVLINYFGVKMFGEMEFILSSIKIVVIIGLIILSAVLALGGGPDHDRKGFRYWKEPGAFRPHITEGVTGKFVGFWASMVTAVFAYLGTELVGVTVGEAANPRKTIPRAIRLTFYRILVFYILTIFLLGLIVPYNSQQLVFATKSSTGGASASPFVVAITLSGIKVLPGIINGCILLFLFSSSNSDLYIATRTIYSLSIGNKAPKFLSRTDKRGVPYNALMVCAMMCSLAFMSVSNDARTVFGYFVNLVTIFGLMTWMSILYSHICFVRARQAQNVPDTSLAYAAPLGARGSWFALVFCAVIAVTKNFECFVLQADGSRGFDWRTFITGYIGIPLYALLFVGYKIKHKTKAVDPLYADLWTGKDKVDREEQEYLAEEAEREENGQGQSRWYKFVSWLF